jgi:hypothetical protein
MKPFLVVAFMGGLTLGSRADEVECTYEVFSLPMREAAKLVRRKLGGAESYRNVLEAVSHKKARLESMAIVRAGNGLES